MKSHRGRITNKKAFRVAARRYLQVRAEELKNLEEKRAALVEEMEGILNKAQEEERAFEESEQVRFDEIEKEINAIDKTIEAKERARNLGNPGGKKKEDGENDDLTVEERAFVDYVRGTLTNEKAPHYHLYEEGHDLVTHNRKNRWGKGKPGTGRKVGKVYAKKTVGKYMARRSEYSEAISQELLNSILEDAGFDS